MKLQWQVREQVRGSALGFGASWDISNAERDEVRKLLAFLEDRRVLYVPQNLEVPGEVERSVQEIRKRCTDALGIVSERSPSLTAIRSIRAACRRFLEEPHADFRNYQPRDHGRFPDQLGFFTALGELRTRVGIQIADLASSYEIEIEPELATILPPDDTD
ncbi:DUF6650 family protein [Mesorhizobium caraganae]|uniref:DUF6650 family protein n=1 Tax=Mesorhizobium caraganae TaxID=483206 RepID=UPI0035E3D6A2